MIDLTALRKACDLATPGPWDSDSVDVWNLTDAGQGFEPGRYVDSVDIVSGRCEECGTYQGVKRDSDAAFIALARTAVPELLDRVAELEAGLREALEIAKRYVPHFSSLVRSDRQLVTVTTNPQKVFDDIAAVDALAELVAK